MAKTKNKKKNKQIVEKQQPGANPAPANAECNAAIPDPGIKSVRKDQENKTRGQVRISTCIGGMFLTLVMGLYLGSLLPGVLEGIKLEKQIASTENRPLQTPPQAPGTPQARMEMPRAGLIPDDMPASIPSGLKRHIAELEKKTAQNPGDANSWIELGNLYFDSGLPPKAINAYQQALNIAPQNPDVLVDMGIMYREEKNFEKALECFRKAAAINPGHINAIFNEGVVLNTDLHKHDEAARAWSRILELNPDARTPDGAKIADLIRSLQ